MRQSMSLVSQKSRAQSSFDFQMHTIDNIRNHVDGMVFVGRVHKTNAVVQVCVSNTPKHALANLPKKTSFFVMRPSML